MSTAKDIQALVKEFEPRIRYFARSFRIPGYEIEDLEQEARGAIIAKATQIQEAESQLAFVNTCLSNHFQDLAKLATDPIDSTRTVSMDEEIGEDDDGGAPLTRHDVIGVEATQDKTEANKPYVSLLERLPERERLIVVDVALGLSKEEIAKKLGISRPRVHQLWTQAQARRPS